MFKKRVTTLLVASVFCSVFPASIAWSQSNDLRCSEQDKFAERLQNCDDSTARRKLNVDPTVTNSLNSGINNSTNANNADSSNDNTASSNDVEGDHDNGHGNDPDHDDSSNPGQGGGNHGADKQ